MCVQEGIENNNHSGHVQFFHFLVFTNFLEGSSPPYIVVIIFSEQNNK